MATDREDFHQLRSRYIGGSEIGAICGCDEYRTPYDIWLSKTGRAEPFEDNAETRRGQALESSIRLLFAQESGYEVEDWNTHIVHADGSAACTPDAYFYLEGQKIGVEIKSFVGYYDQETIIDKHFAAYLQCQWCMYVIGLPKWVLVWMDSALAVKWVEIERNEKVIEMATQTAMAFWQNNVLTDIAPDPIRPADLEKMDVLDEFAEATTHTADLVDEYRGIGKAISALQATKDELADRIKMLIGRRQGFKLNGRKIVSWKADKNGIRVLRTHGN